MSCLRIFLVLAVLLFDSGSASAACCEDWNGDCSLIENSTICKNDYPQCNSSGGTCSNPVCTDYTVANCEGSHGYRDKAILCKWSTTCVDATGVCGDWSTSNCNYASDKSTGSRCFLDGSTCRKKECKDFDSLTCDSARDIGGDDKQCKWDGTNCVAATQCSEYSSASSCAYHSFGGVGCIYASGTCRLETCADNTGQSTCDYNGKCVWGSDGKCTDFTACTQTSSSTKCDYATVGSSKCYYSGTCKVASGCTDCTTSACCNSYSGCDWEVLNQKCTPDAVCSSYTTDLSCDAAGCYPLSSCPATGDSSSTVFVPTLLLAMLLILFW